MYDSEDEDDKEKGSMQKRKAEKIRTREEKRRSLQRVRDSEDEEDKDEGSMRKREAM